MSVLVVADSDLLSDDSMPKRARAFEFTENEIVASAAGSSETWRASWNEIALLVAGRLLVRQIEVEEHQGRKAEREMVDAREMSADESVLDIYCAQNSGGWRITAGKFNFSPDGKTAPREV